MRRAPHNGTRYDSWRRNMGGLYRTAEFLPRCFVPELIRRSIVRVLQPGRFDGDLRCRPKQNTVSFSSKVSSGGTVWRLALRTSTSSLEPRIQRTGAVRWLSLLRRHSKTVSVQRANTRLGSFFPPAIHSLSSNLQKKGNELNKTKETK